MARVGVMGGTFDPVHHGHLVAASEVRHRFELDEVVFVPTGEPWQKTSRVISPTEDRLAMLRLAIAADESFTLSTVDIRRPGPTYTVDTLRDLRRERPEDDELFFITGADALRSILSWRQPEEILDLAHLVGVTRPGFDLTHDHGLPVDRVFLLEVPALAISSSDVRSRVAAGAPIRYLVPDGVVRWIERRGLYRENPGERIQEAGFPVGRHSAPPSPDEVPEYVSPPLSEALTVRRDPVPVQPVAERPLPGALGAVVLPQVAARPDATKVEAVAPVELREREVRHRRWLVITAVIVVLGLVIGGLVALLNSGGGGSDKKAKPTAISTRTQRTLLMTVGIGPNAAVGALLAADSKAGSASVTLLPSRLLVNVAGQGTEGLGRAMASSDSSVGIAAVSDALGISVDNGWQLKSQGLVSLVDAVGGVTVTTGHVNGTQALAYVTDLSADQDEAIRLGHFRDVLQGVLSASPGGAGGTTLLTSLGQNSTSSLKSAELESFLTGLGKEPVSEILPVVPLDAGGDTDSYRLDPAAVKAYVGRVLAGSIPDTKGKPILKIYVINGTGTPGLGARIRPKLVAAGMTLVGSQNATTFDRTQTQVLINGSSTAQRAAGQRVLDALGLPASALKVNEAPTNVADVLVQVGSDLKL